MVCSSHCYRILHHSCFFFNFLFCLPIPLFHHQRNVFCSAPSYCPSPCWWTGLQSFHLQRVCIQILYLPSRQQSQLSLVPLLSEKPSIKVHTCTWILFHEFFFFSLFQWSIHWWLCLFSGSAGTVLIALLIGLREFWLVANSLNIWKAKLLHKRSWSCWLNSKCWNKNTNLMTFVK